MEEISVVYLAWKRLCKMRAINERWSEADYVASVYVSVAVVPLFDVLMLTITLGIMSFGALPSEAASSG